MCLSSKDRAAYARPYWNAATRHGTLEATTTFHEQHDKRDYRYSYGRCGEFVRQDGKRGLALGYLTKVRFTRFLSMPLATELTGVDLTRPGRSAEQAARVAVVAEEFFELLVRYSRSHPFRDGDYGNVARSRQLQDGSFCIFTGFVEAVASHKLTALRETWKARYAPDRGAAAPPSPQRAPPPTSPPPVPAPPPAPPPPSPAADLDLDRLEAQLVAHLEAPLACASQELGASGCCVRAQTPLYVVQLTVSGRRASHGAARLSAVAKGALKRRLRVAAMCSVAEVRRAFGRARPPSGSFN
jgi:hypothetical protein